MAANLSGVLLSLRLTSLVVHPDASKCNELGPRIVCIRESLHVVSHASFARQHCTPSLQGVDEWCVVAPQITVRSDMCSFRHFPSSTALAKSALIVNGKLQEQNFGGQLDFGPVVRTVLFKLFIVSESIIESLVSSYNSYLSSDIFQNSNSITLEALICH
jgi:hypothetical protein